VINTLQICSTMKLHRTFKSTIPAHIFHLSITVLPLHLTTDTQYAPKEHLQSFFISSSVGDEMVKIKQKKVSNFEMQRKRGNVKLYQTG